MEVIANNGDIFMKYHMRMHCGEFQRGKSLSFNLRHLTEEEIIIPESHYDATNVDLGYNNITDLSKINGVDKLTEVRGLYIMESQLITTRGIENMINLGCISIHENNIRELVGFEKLNKLRYLELVYNEITDISGLRHLTNLEYLNMQSNRITDISPIIHLQKLKVANFGWNPIDIQKIDPFCIPDSLEYLGLDTSCSIENYKRFNCKDIIETSDNQNICEIRLKYLKQQKKYILEIKSFIELWYVDHHLLKPFHPLRRIELMKGFNQYNIQK
jgi:Leucine-rich repeat (LRR) protein